MACLPRFVSTTARAALNPPLWRKATVSFNSLSFSEIRLLSVATRMRCAGSSDTAAPSCLNVAGRAVIAVL